MIDGIGGSSMMSRRPPPPSNDLTDQQSTKLSEVLSGYDASSLTDDDATAIVAQIEELGIAPGAGLASALNEAGFDAQQLGAQAAGPPRDGPPPPPPPPGGSGVDSVDQEAVAMLVKILESYESAGEGGEVWSDLFEELDASGFDSSKPIVDFYS